jgi:hypothetical protein
VAGGRVVLTTEPTPRAAGGERVAPLHHLDA